MLGGKSFRAKGGKGCSALAEPRFSGRDRTPAPLLGPVDAGCTFPRGSGVARAANESVAAGRQLRGSGRPQHDRVSRFPPAERLARNGADPPSVSREVRRGAPAGGCPPAESDKVRSGASRWTIGQCTERDPRYVTSGRLLTHEPSLIGASFAMTNASGDTRNWAGHLAGSKKSGEVAGAAAVASHRVADLAATSVSSSALRFTLPWV